MIAILWRYEVREEHLPSFECTYGPAGEWAKLFGRSDGYLGTELLSAADGAFLTIDRWRDKAALDAFISEHGDDYQALDRLCETWTSSEQKLGEFEVRG